MGLEVLLSAMLFAVRLWCEFFCSYTDFCFLWKGNGQREFVMPSGCFHHLDHIAKLF